MKWLSKVISRGTDVHGFEEVNFAPDVAIII